MDKPKPLTNANSAVAAILAARQSKGIISRTPAGTKRARQFSEAKGTGQSLQRLTDPTYLPLLPHVGKKQIAKALRRMEKQKNKQKS